MPLPAVAISVAVGAASLFLTSFFGGPHDFAPGACERVEPYLFSELVGQELAIHQFSDAVCDHINNPNPIKPLVVSAHGPPGVGKTLMHLLAARALYNKKPAQQLDCPGSACLGYKVLYGMDYTAAERRQQHEMLKAAVLDHASHHPQSLLVIEEYDKLDCPTRGLLKQLIDSSRSMNVTMDRSIILLESNTGFPQLHQMLVSAGSRDQVSPEDAQRMLKDLIFSLWATGGCEDRTDTAKLLSLIDFYLPFLPLERRHIQQLFRMRLWDRQAQHLQESGDMLTWDEDIVDFLADKVDFDDAYPIEGAKEVKTLMSRYVTRALKVWSAVRLRKEEQLQKEQLEAQQAAKDKKRRNYRPRIPPMDLLLTVSHDSKGLIIQPTIESRDLHIIGTTDQQR